MGEVMKVVILAGGMGTRIAEESQSKPKPMVDIGGIPIIWHIMKIYSSYGFNDFVICCGYKGQMIKDFFLKYYINHSDVTFSLNGNGVNVENKQKENWKVTLANTGLNTLTAGRILKIRNYIGSDEEFMLTYGDGVADIDINKLIEFHHSHGKIATISSTQPPGRFGALMIDSATGEVHGFKEKARKDSAWVNIGFMVLNRRVFDYLGDGSEMLEAGPFEKLAESGQMATYQHDGFWSPMDNIHDRDYLEKLWTSGQAYWKLW